VKTQGAIGDKTHSHEWIISQKKI